MYASCRGDIVFYKGNSLMDKVIRLVTGSEYTHCAIVVNRDYMVEAIAKSITISRIRPYDAIWSYYRHATYYSYPVLYNNIQWLNRQIGHGYGWRDIVAYALHRLSFPLRIKSHREYDCSDLCTRFLARTGEFDLKGIEQYPNVVTPGELHDVLFSLPEVRNE